MANALSQIFVVLNKTGTSAGITIGSVAVSLAVGAALVPHLEIPGVFVARGASLVISLALSAALLGKLLRLRFDMEAYRSAWMASLLMAAAVLAFEASFYSKYLLPVYVVVGGGVFFLTLRPLRAVDREDIQLASDFLGPRLRFIGEWTRRLLKSRTARIARESQEQHSTVMIRHGDRVPQGTLLGFCHLRALQKGMVINGIQKRSWYSVRAGRSASTSLSSTPERTLHEVPRA